MNKKLHFALLALLLAGLAGCKKPSKNQPAKLPFSKEKIATLSPQTLRETARILDDPALVDTIFKTAIAACQQPGKKQNHLVAYLSMYDSLRGADPAVRVFVLIEHGKILLSQSRLDSSNLLFQQAIQISKNEKMLRDEARARQLLGENLHQRGEYANSASEYMEAKKLFRQAGDELAQQVVVLCEAENFSRNDQFELSSEYARSTLPFFEKQKDTLQLASVFNLLGVNFKFGNQLDSSLFYHQKALALRQSVGNMQGISESLNNIAAVKMRAKQYLEAADFFKKAIEISEKTDNALNLGMLHSNLGLCFQLLGKYDEARQQLLRARDFLKNTGQHHAAIYNLDRLASLEIRSGNHREALQFFLDGKALRDSTVQRQQQEFQQKLAAAENESRLAQLAIRQKNVNLTLLAGAVAAVLLLSVLLFWFLRLRHKARILAQEQQLIDFREKEKLKDLEMAKLELAIQQHSLAETTSELAAKNSLLEELSAILEQYKLHGAPAVERRNAQVALTGLYGLQILTSDDWKTFRERFEQMHPGFIREVKAKFPEVSDAELRLILLIKMGIRSREIAPMLGIAADSVSKTRHRLRKKLGLLESEKLEEFIQNYG